jgi:hypothetical protein
MIAKIKFIHNGVIKHILKRSIDWNLVGFQFMLQPQVGMTVIIPQGSKGSFRFYIGYIMADLRTGDTVLVERRDFGRTYSDETKMLELVKQLKDWGWEREEE